jgi:hypothetical protein
VFQRSERGNDVQISMGMMYSRDAKQQTESVAISLSYLHDSHRDPMNQYQYLDREVAYWLIDRGVADNIKDAEWWVDKVNKPNCVRVWIRDESLRMLFKLTFGGV